MAIDLPIVSVKEELHRSMPPTLFEFFIAYCSHVQLIGCIVNYLGARVQRLGESEIFRFNYSGNISKHGYPMDS